MNKTNILNKLHTFIQIPTAFKKECEVVYFLVEIRKLIEGNKNNYKTLYFYCCWVAHSKLSYSTIADFLSVKFNRHIDLQKGKREIQKDLINGQNDFFKLKDFNNELKRILSKNKLPVNFLKGDMWHKFCQLFLDNIIECEIDISGANRKYQKINKLTVEKVNGQYLYGFYLVNGMRIPRIILKFNDI